MNQTSEILEISEVSARVTNPSVPLAALALIGGAGALVAESKRRKGEGLTEAQRRVGQVSDLPNGADAKIERMEAAEAAAIAAAQEAKRKKDEPLDSAAQSYMAWGKAIEDGKFDTQRYAEEMEKFSHEPACTPENVQKPKTWWQRAGEWISSPSTWWGFSTEDEAIKLMQKAKGFPDIPIILPMLKGFGMDDVAGPLKYTIKTDTTLRLIGRVMDDASPGLLTGVGWGLTVTPNLVKNIRNGSPWNQIAADLLVDTGGFVVSEIAGWGAGLIAGGITVAIGAPVAAPYVTLAAKTMVDGYVSIKWDEWAEVNQWNKWLGQKMQEGSQFFGRSISDSMQQAMDTQKYPPIPTPPSISHTTGTPTPFGQNPPIIPSGTPTPTNTSVPPKPTPPPTP